MAAEPSRWTACTAETLPARIDATRRTSSSHPASIALSETRRTEAIVAQAGTGVVALDAAGRVALINPRG